MDKKFALVISLFRHGDRTFVNRVGWKNELDPRNDRCDGRKLENDLVRILHDDVQLSAPSSLKLNSKVNRTTMNRRVLSVSIDTDPSFEDANNKLYDWTCVENSGFGQLTGDGRKQHEYVGREMRKRYIADDAADLTADFFHVRASNKTRTKMSAKAQLSTLMSSRDGATIDVPINTVSASRENLLRGHDKKACRMIGAEDKSYLVKEFKNKNYNIYDSSDPVFIIDAHPNLSPYIEYTIEERSWMRQQANGVFRAMLPHRLNRIVVGTVASEITRILRKTANGERWSNTASPFDETLPPIEDTGKDPRMVLYAAHDTTLMAILLALGQKNIEIPEYASQVIFEMDDEKCITIWFNNDLGKMFSRTIEFCDQECCTVEHLSHVFRNYGAMYESLDEVRQKCGSERKKSYDGSLAHGIMLGVFIVIIISLLGAFLWKRYVPQNQVFEAHPEQPVADIIGKEARS